MKTKFTKEYLIELWNNLKNSIKYSIENTFNYKTRSSRKEIISFTIGVILAFILVNLLTSFSNTINSILTELLTLITIFPSISICVRRMHDINKSGLYLLIPLFLVIITIIVVNLDVSLYVEKIAEKFYLLTILTLVSILSKNGDAQDNKYGKVPTI